MARQPTIVPFGARHLDVAAAVLAAWYRARRADAPALPSRYEDVATARDFLSERVLGDDGASGVAAVLAGAVVGYLLATVVAPEPQSADAVYLPARSVRMPAGGAMALADDGETYRAMYAAVAPGWLAAGCTWHDVLVPGVHRAALWPWFTLGFGMESIRGVRATAVEVPGAHLPDDIAVRRAGPDDAETVARLLLANAAHHARSPVFLPLVPEAPDILHRATVEALASGDAGLVWLAERGGRVVSLIAFESLSADGTITTPPASIYLADAYTDPSERGGGVATALLAHCLAWVHDAGFRYCTVSWDTPNLAGSRFWLRHGFHPVSAHLRRLVDERALWATPPS